MFVKHKFEQRTAEESVVERDLSGWNQNESLGCCWNLGLMLIQSVHNGRDGGECSCDEMEWVGKELSMQNTIKLKHSPRMRTRRILC